MAVILADRERSTPKKRGDPFAAEPSSRVQETKGGGLHLSVARRRRDERSNGDAVIHPQSKRIDLEFLHVVNDARNHVAPSPPRTDRFNCPDGFGTVEGELKLAARTHTFSLGERETVRVEVGDWPMSHQSTSSTVDRASWSCVGRRGGFITMDGTGRCATPSPTLRAEDR